MTEGAASMVPVPAAGVVWVTVDDEIVALGPTGHAHVISSTGALLWPALDGVTSAAELAADVAEVFDIEVDVALADVGRLVDEMVALGLVVGPDDAE